MFKGDLIIEKCAKKAVILIGQTKVGKSTSFNYMIGKKLKPVEINDGLDTIY